MGMKRYLRSSIEAIEMALQDAFTHGRRRTAGPRSFIYGCRTSRFSVSRERERLRFCGGANGRVWGRTWWCSLRAGFILWKGSTAQRKPSQKTRPSLKLRFWNVRGRSWLRETTSSCCARSSGVSGDRNFIFILFEYGRRAKLAIERECSKFGRRLREEVGQDGRSASWRQVHAV